MRWIRQRAASLVHRLRQHRTTAGTAFLGVVLVAVPTAFTVVPEWAEANGLAFGHRLGVVGVWLLVALVAVVSNTKIEGLLDRLLTQEAADRTLRMEVAQGTIVETLLRPSLTPQGIPRQYDFELFVFDESAGELQCVWPRMGDLVVGDPADPRIFKPGNGATGRAWSEQTTITVEGPNVADGAFDLTSEQQQFYAARQVVCAALVQAVSGKPIGVLTALADKDDRFFTAKAGQNGLEKLATTIGATLDRMAVTPRT